MPIKDKFSLSEKKIMSNTYLNKLPCRNYLEKPGNKNALDNKAFLVIIKLWEDRSSLLLKP